MAEPDRNDLNDVAREGFEHLQTAAKEMIAATRSMLDAAEKLVDDPETAAGIVSAFRSFAKLAGEAMSRAGLGAPNRSDDDEPRVQRVKVT